MSWDSRKEIENRLKQWQEKQRCLEEVEEAPLNDDQTNPLWIGICSVNVMEHSLKSAAIRSDDEGSYEETRAGALGILGHGD